MGYEKWWYWVAQDGLNIKTKQHQHKTQNTRHQNENRKQKYNTNNNNKTHSRMSNLSTKARRLMQYFDPIFLRNRAMYVLAANPPLDDGYGGGEDAGPPLDQRPPPTRWDVSALRGTVSCPQEEGLFLHRTFIPPQELQQMECFVAAASTKHDWFTYHMGRDMMPINSVQRPQDAARSSDLQKLLLSLQSANNTDPVTWPYLEEWCEPAYTECSGAQSLALVQQRIQNGELLPTAFNEPCLFIQIQNVIRGGVVGSHIDPLVKGGKCIATLIINGITDVRVGNTVFQVEPGDIYGIEGHARYNIEHEVHPTVDDRLTATLRFGHDDERR